MKYISELTFKDVVPKDLGWIKIIWNNKVIYDDELGNETLESTQRIEQLISNKKVYSLKLTVVQFHHCILDIQGGILDI